MGGIFHRPTGPGRCTGTGRRRAEADRHGGRLERPGRRRVPGEVPGGAGQPAASGRNHSATLAWTRGQAAQAISQWNSAQNATRQARSQYEKYEQQGGAAPFQDPGGAARIAAKSLLDTARSDLRDAGNEVAGVIGQERNHAPEKPSFWSKVKDVASDVGAVLQNAGGHVVNALASVGNSMIHHPGDVAAAVGGSFLAAAGATGELGGFVLDATVVGAAPGLALNGISAAGMAAGGTITYAAARDLAMHAAGDEQPA